MPYQWVKYLHIASAIGFASVHGASIAVLYAIRNERDRKRLLATLDFSGRTATAMYISLGAILATGLWMGWLQQFWLHRRWYWSALVLLVVVTLLMLWVAKPFTERIRSACEIRPSGIPRKSDEELGDILHSGRVHVIAAIGIIGIGLILYLMVFKPPLWG
jgi:uncharacterized membrane protein